MNHQDFQRAYCLYLTNYDFRALMIQCGIDALLSGVDSEHVVLLAGADFESDSELVDLFLKAAAEIGLFLPPVDDSELWLAKTILELEQEKVDLPKFMPKDGFNRNMLVIYSEMALRATRDRSLAGFVAEFGKLLGQTGCIHGYEKWRVGLEAFPGLVYEGENRRFVAEIVGLVNWFSYGGTTEEHVAESRKIALELLQSFGAEVTH